MTFKWESDPEKEMVRLGEEYADAINAGVKAVCQKWAPQIENWMKETAIWTDRTGNARQSLWSDVEQVSRTLIRLYMSHGVDYGKWLELLHAGRYAIVSPALDRFAPKIWADIKRMLS